MKKNNLTYYFLYDPKTIPGVHKKLIGTLNAAKFLGYNVEIYSDIAKGSPSFLKMLLNIAFKNDNIIIIRSVFYLNFLIMPFSLIARIRGKKVLYDVPTPFKSAYFEILESDKSFYNKIKMIIGMYIGASWSLYPGNKILTYSDDFFCFKIGLKQKTLLIGNGIDVESIKKRKKLPEWPNSELRLIGVANVSKFHGYDRILYTISEFNKLNKYKIYFTIVGDGKEITNLKNITLELNINNFVQFVGWLNTEELYDYYDNSHIAIGAIGIHRKKMKLHSELKAREYMAVGIPFISSGIDIDFTDNFKYRKSVSMDDKIDDLINIFNNIDEFLSDLNIDEMRNFALDNLSFKTKINDILT